MSGLWTMPTVWDATVLTFVSAAIFASFAAGEWISHSVWCRDWLERNAPVLDLSELARKFVHAFSGTILAFLPWTKASALVGITIGVSFFLILLSAKLIQERADVLRYLFSKRNGAVTFAVMVAVMSACFFSEARVFTASLLVLAWADPAAALTGMIWGRRRLGGKTWEGFLAHAAVSFAVLFFMGLPGLSIALALALSVTLSVVEVSLSRGLDNLGVPVACASLLRLVGGLAG